MSDILVVTSKVKKHIKETHDLRTSEDTLTALSQVVVKLCAEAAAKAKADKRKTVQAKDFE